MLLKDILKKGQIAERIRVIYKYSWLWRIVRAIKDAIWYPVVYRTTHRYHILDLRDGGNGYGLGWYDADTRLLQANFTLLKEFVEKEQPFKNIDWDWCDESKATAQEIKELYAWWTVERQKKHAILSQEWSNLEQHKFTPLEGGGFTLETDPHGKNLLDREAELDKEDTEMLIRLIKIRKSLWT